MGELISGNFALTAANESRVNLGATRSPLGCSWCSALAVGVSSTGVHSAVLIYHLCIAEVMVSAESVDE